MDKYQHNDVVGIERENERDKNYHSKVNPQIDSERTPLNYHVIKKQGSYLDHINRRIEEIKPKRKIKQNAVLLASFILGASRAFFEEKSREEIDRFFYDCANFFAERYGEENIVSAIVHLDETNPHMHLNLVPVFENRLCCKKLFDRTALRELQTEFYESVGKPWGLQRGKEGSTATHLETEAFKLKKMKEEAAETISESNKATEQAKTKIAEAERVHKAAKPAFEILDAYEKVKSEKIPFSGKQKEAEIIALRTKNSQLEKQNSTLIKDNEGLFKEIKKREQDLETGQRSLDILLKLKKYAPDELAHAQRVANERKAQKSKLPFSTNNNWRTK